MLAASKTGASLEWLIDRRHRRSIPHRMERCGYVTCRNPNADDGLWFINGRRHTRMEKRACHRTSEFRQRDSTRQPLAASDEAPEGHVTQFFPFFLSLARFCCGNRRLKEKEEN
jgi:hypothetical protein